MKHLKLFNDAVSYEAWKNSEEYVLPNVSYVVETEDVSFEPYVKTHPNNVITYKSSSKLLETVVDNDRTDGYGNYVTTTTTYFDRTAFNANVVSHEFANGIGTITFDADVTEVRYHAFNRCYELTEITLPDTVIAVDTNAFVNCYGFPYVNDLQIAGGKIVIGSSASGVVTVPEGVLTIGCQFNGLNKITLPSTLNYICNNAFSDC